MEAVICGDSFDDRNKTTTQEVFDEIVRVVKEVSPMCKKFRWLKIIGIADRIEQLVNCSFRLSTPATSGHSVLSNDSRVLLTSHPSVTKSS